MYKTILVPIAIEHDADVAGALEIARHLRDVGGSIIALNVIEPVPAFVANELPVNHIEKTAEDVRELLIKEIGEADDVTPIVTHGHSGRAIIEFAEQNGVDCIVIASHRPGLADYFLGSTAARVVRHSQCAVHVIR